MVLIAGTCIVLLCVLLFLAGMEIGKRMVAPGDLLSVSIADKPLEGVKLPKDVKEPKLPGAEDLVKTLVPEKK